MTQRRITFTISKTGDMLVPQAEHYTGFLNPTVDLFPFALAFETIRQMPDRYVMARKGWNGSGMHVTMAKLAIVNGVNIDNDCLVLKNVQGNFNTWIPSGTDLMAEDWFLIEIIDTTVAEDFSIGGNKNVAIA